jgi:nucleotide-binding universal stress UspA family protein
MQRLDDLSGENLMSRSAQHLALDGLIVDPRLARRLPPAVAFRYHTLLLAEDKRCITVAMANPADKAALDAVTAAIGTRPYIVQSESSAIDSLLAEIWPEATRHSPRLLVYRPPSQGADQLYAYASYLVDLLGGDGADACTLARGDATLDELTLETTHGYDVVILGETDQSLIERLVSGSLELKILERIAASLLIARHPRWPIRRLLLITRGGETDEAAVDWTVRLAQPSGATVTVLAVAPDMPAMCRETARARYGLADWLATDTILGRQLRRIAQRLDHWGTEGTLRFRQGPPGRQIGCEVIEGDYDLIVIAPDPPGIWLRRLQGELVVSPLLGKTDRPVLIAKLKTA